MEAVLYTRKETAETLCVTPRCIIKWEKLNKIKPVLYINGRPRYHIDDIASIASVKQKPAHV